MTGPFRSIVPPESAGTLDQKVDRGEIGDQGVEVEIQRLLYHLGRDEHPAGALGGTAILAERSGHSTLDVQSIRKRETGMEEVGRQPTVCQRRMCVECVVHRIANVEHSLTGACSALDGVQPLVRSPQKAHR